MRAIRAYAPVPVVLFAYANIIFQQGWDRFAARAARAGADALLVVDLPPEESGDLSAATARHGLDLIRLIAPTTSAARRRQILAGASGFVYLIAIEGVTGARDDLPAHLTGLIGALRQETHLPLAVGFGVSRPEHVRAIAAAGADAVVVGSAVVQIIEGDPGGGEEMVQAVRSYVAGMMGRS
ncbi:MAG: tryptophan synthase subunit alpha [Methanoculleus sp.]